MGLCPRTAESQGRARRAIAPDRYAAVPSSIVGMLTDLFDVELSGEAKDVLIEGDSRNSEAHKFYIQAVGYAGRFEQDQDTETAIGLYQLAIRQDSSYALAYAGLARHLRPARLYSPSRSTPGWMRSARQTLSTCWRVSSSRDPYRTRTA
ncbi:MAG: hypothetical protein ACI80V_002056 [Rhodothermales bacterium]|jgi:hypothetical protein